MSLSREDMLRELELLPVWRARVPAPASAGVVAETVAEPIELLAVSTEVAAQPVDDLLPGVVDIEVPVLMAQQASPERLSTASDLDLPEAVTAPLVQTPWLLYCPQVGDGAGQLLLQNIVRALQLPSEAVTLYTQTLTMQQVNTRFCVLFGLEQANLFLAENHQSIDAVRGHIHTFGDMRVVITHHPQAMLQTPLLKRDVWQDMCLLLAKHTEAAA